MFHYFDGVTDETWLDNSTPLVKNADKYDPDLAPEFSNFCDYYPPSDTQLNRVKAGIRLWSKTPLSSSKTEF